jgi:hypothetical protein
VRSQALSEASYKLAEAVYSSAQQDGGASSDGSSSTSEADEEVVEDAEIVDEAEEARK